MNRPNSRRNLDLALQQTFGIGDEFLKVRTLMANTIVGALLPNGAVKGGSAIKLRLGDRSTRFTSDLDIVRSNDLEEFTAEFNSALANGWNGFTGRLVARRPAKPKNVPTEYVMQPYEVKLSYSNKPWITVLLEIGHNEIGDAESPDWDISQDIVAIFEKLDFPAPKPMPLMPMKHQIAQKLHGASALNSERAHDLIDLQLIFANGDYDLKEVRETCERLFLYRNSQKWPPAIQRGDRWDELYAAQAEGLSVFNEVDEAISWANKLIQHISEA